MNNKYIVYHTAQLSNNITQKRVLVSFLKSRHTHTHARTHPYGGTRFSQLNSLATQLWMWCLERGITLSAKRLPGEDNGVADEESQGSAE